MLTPIGSPCFSYKPVKGFMERVWFSDVTLWPLSVFRSLDCLCLGFLCCSRSPAAAFVHHVITGASSKNPCSNIPTLPADECQTHSDAGFSLCFCMFSCEHCLDVLCRGRCYLAPFTCRDELEPQCDHTDLQDKSINTTTQASGTLHANV